jgi:hypothetical protein
MSCQGPAEESPEPPQPASSETDAPLVLPLKEIMQGLERDLNDLAHGIWIEDHGTAVAAARRIADHPRVPPEQMAAIQASLLDEFPGFVREDAGVHNAAAAFAEASPSSLATEEVFTVFLQIQQGCRSCHLSFRVRVSEALSGSGDNEG